MNCGFCLAQAPGWMLDCGCCVAQALGFWIATFGLAQAPGGISNCGFGLDTIPQGILNCGFCVARAPRDISNCDFSKKSQVNPDIDSFTNVKSHNSEGSVVGHLGTATFQKSHNWFCLHLVNPQSGRHNFSRLWNCALSPFKQSGLRLFQKVTTPRGVFAAAPELRLLVVAWLQESF